MINIISPINSLGYGVAGLNLCKELNQISPTSLFPIGRPDVSSQSDFDVVNEMVSNSRFVDFELPCVRIWHQHDMSQFVGNGEKIGFPIFELDNFTNLEKHHLSHPDRLFVCSEWAKEVVVNTVGIKEENIFVIPLGVDPQVFKPCEPNDREKTVFFNCGKWEVRKGHDVIVKAFNLAFEKKDDVELKMMCSNPFNSEEEEDGWNKLYKTSKLGDKITLIGRVQTHEEVYNIMCESDCGIFPARGEGWNLELLEMMSCNRPVIATNYSAHTEFCNQENSFLIDIDSKEVAQDNKFFHGDIGSWANISEPQLEQIVDFMRHVHLNNVKTNQSGVSTSKEFTWRNSAIKITEALGV